MPPTDDVEFALKSTDARGAVPTPADEDDVDEVNTGWWRRSRRDAVFKSMKDKIKLIEMVNGGSKEW